jgi:hypothetical protein
MVKNLQNTTRAQRTHLAINRHQHKPSCSIENRVTRPGTPCYPRVDTTNSEGAPLRAEEHSTESELHRHLCCGTSTLLGIGGFFSLDTNFVRTGMRIAKLSTLPPGQSPPPTSRRVSFHKETPTSPNIAMYNPYRVRDPGKQDRGLTKHHLMLMKFRRNC